MKMQCSTWGVEDYLIEECATTGTNKGPIVAPGFKLPATNKAVNMHGVDVMQIKDGKAVKGISYGNGMEIDDPARSHQAGEAEADAAKKDTAKKRRGEARGDEARDEVTSHEVKIEARHSAARTILSAWARACVVGCMRWCTSSHSVQRAAPASFLRSAGRPLGSDPRSAGRSVHPLREARPHREDRRVRQGLLPAAKRRVDPGGLRARRVDPGARRD